MVRIGKLLRHDLWFWLKGKEETIVEEPQKKETKEERDIKNMMEMNNIGKKLEEIFGLPKEKALTKEEEFIDLVYQLGVLGKEYSTAGEPIGRDYYITRFKLYDPEIDDKFDKYVGEQEEQRGERE